MFPPVSILARSIPKDSLPNQTLSGGAVTTSFGSNGLNPILIRTLGIHDLLHRSRNSMEKHLTEDFAFPDFRIGERLSAYPMPLRHKCGYLKGRVWMDRPERQVEHQPSLVASGWYLVITLSRTTDSDALLPRSASQWFSPRERRAVCLSRVTSVLTLYGSLEP